MDWEQLMTELRKKEDPKVYAELGYRDASVIPLFIEVMEKEKTAVKYQAEKAVRKISEERPAMLLPYVDRLIGLLDSDNNFIRWGMLLTLPGLLEAGGKDIWMKMRTRYLLSFRSRQVAEFGNAVSSTGKILRACPEEEETIIPLLLKIDRHTFFHHGVPSPECLNVAKGHILECFLEQFPDTAYRTEMASFAKQNLENDRKQVCIRARRLMKLAGEV